MQGELEGSWSDRLCKCNPFFPRQDRKGAGVIGSLNAILEGMEGGYLPLYDMLRILFKLSDNGYGIGEMGE